MELSSDHVQVTPTPPTEFDHGAEAARILRRVRDALQIMTSDQVAAASARAQAHATLALAAETRTANLLAASYRERDFTTGETMRQDAMGRLGYSSPLIEETGA